MKRVIKTVFLIIMMVTLMLGAFVGVVFIEYQVKLPDKTTPMTYETADEFWQISQKEGYTVSPIIFSGKVKEESFSTTTYHKKGKVIRVLNSFQYSFESGDYSFISVEITTNPDNSMLKKLTKNQWMSGIKTRLKAHNEEFELVKMKVVDVDCSGIIYADGEGVVREYTVALVCNYAEDCEVKIVLSCPTGGESYDENVLYNKCISHVGEILKDIG